MDEDAQVELLQALVGTWTTEATHPMLNGVVHGQVVHRWLEGDRFLVGRSHHDHAEVPDALTVTGITDEELSMHYFDSRGVHRVYRVSMAPGTWRFWRDAPGFSQRFTGTFSDDGRTITGHGELSRDGVTWEGDLSLVYRRTA